VYVNNQKLDESPYLGSDVRTYGGSFMKEGEPVSVPQGEFLVMGDNRPYSSDSREWGLLERDAIIGKSFFVYWPLTSMHVIKNPFPNKK
jgi:signal peptidase I